MTAKEAKDFLYFEARMIQDYRERVQHLREGFRRSSDLCAAPVQGGVYGDKVSWVVGEIERLEGLMQGHIERVWASLVFLDTPSQRDVVRLRYLDFFGHKDVWGDIALEMKYSEPHVKRMHGQSLILIAQKVSS